MFSLFGAKSWTFRRVGEAVFLSCFLTASLLSADSTHTLVIQDVERNFIVHVPPSYDGSKPYPLLLMFHGMGATAAAAASSTYDWQSMADSNRFIVVFPDSTTPPGKNIEFLGIVLFENYDGTGKRWDVAHVLSADRTDSQDVDFVDAILDWMEANYNIRTTHVFATGHSYGAFFSYYISVCLPDRIKAFAEHSGGIMTYQFLLTTIYWPISVPNKPPTLQGLLLHSTGDGTVGYTNSVTLQTQMNLKGQTNELITLATELGHGWDKTKNQTQWDFFLAHAALIDDDGDGMYDFWEDDQGLDSTINDAWADNDGDGDPNLHEYLAGTAPTNGQSVLKFVESSCPMPDQAILCWAGLANKSYSIWYSTNLSEGFTAVGVVIPGYSPMNTYTASLSGAATYYRLRVEPK